MVSLMVWWVLSRFKTYLHGKTFLLIQQVPICGSGRNPASMVGPSIESYIRILLTLEKFLAIGRYCDFYSLDSVIGVISGLATSKDQSSKQ